MGSLRGPVICPTIRAKQVGLPMVSFPIKARIIRSEFWGFKGISGPVAKLGFLSRQLSVRKCKGINCTFSSSSNDNGSMAENFNENDEDYVNSSVLEAGLSSSLLRRACFRLLFVLFLLLLILSALFLNLKVNNLGHLWMLLTDLYVYDCCDM